MRDYVLTLLVTAAVTYLLTPLVRRLAIRVGAIHEARDRDVHVVPIPRLGGLAMYGGLAVGLLVASRIPQLRAGIAGTGMISGLLLAGGLLVAIGFVDDRWGVSAVPKLAGQVAAGGILVATGTQITWLPQPAGGIFIPTTDQKTIITILVVVATINAVNFIDGLDGLAAGIVAIAAISFLIYYYSLTKVVGIPSLTPGLLASAILIGMCVGFLPHNFSPARIFMGDTGAMLLGLLLAYAPISSIAGTDPSLLATKVNRYPEIMPLLLPAALLVIPYADLLLAVVRRTRAGQSPFAPDRKHLHHRLLDIGHSQRASVLIMYLWAAAFSGSVVYLSIAKTEVKSNHHGTPIFILMAITAAALAVLLLMSMPRLRWWEARSRRSAASAAGNGQLTGQAAQPGGAATSADGVLAAAQTEAEAARAEAELVSVAAARPLPGPVESAGPAQWSGRRPGGSSVQDTVAPSPARSIVGLVPPASGISPLASPFPSESASDSQPEPADAEPAANGAEPDQEGRAR
ncbi:MAG: undecaprenyl/decaprenyl-phosphate alpha-N-acetylglucosaminyl 1-phosphate transferase [Streptosporangiaceae bacterium]